MVVDSLQNASLYAGLGERIARALSFIREQDFSRQEPGRRDLEGSSLYYMVQSYATKAPGAWEAHRRYLDVQYVVRGRERIGWAPHSTLKVARPYDTGSDAELLEGEGTFVTAGAGTFFLLWPQDAHMPGIMEGSPSDVLKVVVKVLL